MPTHVEVTGGKYEFVYTDEGDGHEITRRELKLVYKDEPGGNQLIRLGLFDDGDEVAELIRCSPVDGGQRVSADFPGCDPLYVVTDSTGRVTTG